MRVLGVVLSCTVLLAFTALSVTAEAGDRRKFRRLGAPGDHYYAGPGFVHRMPGLRLMFGDYALSEEEFNALYGEGEEFDESYYEPQPLATTKPKVKPAAKPAIAAKPAAVKPVTASNAEGPVTAPPPAPAATTALTCGKAGTIIEGYGFSGVKAGSCKGKVYAFNATRDGKSFAIKVNAANGELTEVKKLN